MAITKHKLNLKFPKEKKVKTTNKKTKEKR